MIDVDRFKAINDDYGHARRRRRAARGHQAPATALRDADVAGRLGGDELLVLLPDTDGERRRGRCARSIRVAVAERAGGHGAGAGRTSTVSLGIAAWGGEDAAVLLERADQALYAAKDAGRDRAVAAI